MKKFVIHKSSRLPNCETFQSWVFDKAQINHLFRKHYYSRKEAIRVARNLSKFNPVGYSVSEAPPNSVDFAGNGGLPTWYARAITNGYA